MSYMHYLSQDFVRAWLRISRLERFSEAAGVLDHDRRERRARTGNHGQQPSNAARGRVANGDKRGVDSLESDAPAFGPGRDRGAAQGTVTPQS
jgi:hypothetical protein